MKFIISLDAVSLCYMNLRLPIYVHIYIPESDRDVSSSMAISRTPLYDAIRGMMNLSVDPIQVYLLCDGNIRYVGDSH